MVISRFYIYLRKFMAVMNIMIQIIFKLNLSNYQLCKVFRSGVWENINFIYFLSYNEFINNFFIFFLYIEYYFVKNKKSS